MATLPPQTQSAPATVCARRQAFTLAEMLVVTVSAIALVLFLFPASAPATVRVHIEDKDVTPDPGGGRFTLDVTLEGVDDENEMLQGYTLGFLLLEQVAGRPGDVGFAAPYAEKPNGFVFGDHPGAFIVANSPAPSPARFLLDAWSDSYYPDHGAAPVGAARIVLEYAPGALPSSEYRVRLIEEFAAFATAFPGGERPGLGADLRDVGVIRLPEPAALLPLAALSVLALARRRRVAVTALR